MPDLEKHEYIFRPNFIRIKTEVKHGSADVGNCGYFSSQLTLGEMRQGTSSFLFTFKANHKLFEDPSFIQKLEQVFGLHCYHAYEQY